MAAQTANEDPDERADTPRSDLDANTPSRRRRFLPLLLLVGVGAALWPVASRAPKEHAIDFRFEGDVASVVRLGVDWTRLDGDVRGDVVAGESLRFERGHAPEITSVVVRLPNGSYALDIVIERSDHAESIQRRVTLGDADRITVPLRVDPPRP